MLKRFTRSYRTQNNKQNSEITKSRFIYADLMTISGKQMLSDNMICPSKNAKIKVY